jgi:hypothetical protein
MDNCLSLFKNYFADPINYSYDMTELGQYYNLYRDLMAYWHQTLPGFIYDLSYEELVADPEPEIRRLLEYCDLSWDENCLDFHQTRRKVRTDLPGFGASVEALRKTIAAPAARN